MFKIFLESQQRTRSPALFHSFRAEQVNGLSKSFVPDNGMCSSTFFDDLKLNECISDKGVNNSER